MKTLSYNIKIYATPERVWDILWGTETYNVWTKFFSCDSQMKSDWKVGGKPILLMVMEMGWYRQ